MKENLIKLGAIQRLSELNKERDVLLNFLNRRDDSGKAKEVMQTVKQVSKKKHWTQTTAGRAKMRTFMKKRYASGWRPNKGKK